LHVSQWDADAVVAWLHETNFGAFEKVFRGKKSHICCINRVKCQSYFAKERTKKNRALSHYLSRIDTNYDKKSTFCLVIFYK
jgi:hypothetical protein